jgi:hypothetical protein
VVIDIVKPIINRNRRQCKAQARPATPSGRTFDVHRQIRGQVRQSDIAELFGDWIVTAKSANARQECVFIALIEDRRDRAALRLPQ